MANNGANIIPERLINFRIWNDNKDYMGVATVDLPSIEAMTDTVSGAGIAGEVDSPVLGHFGPLELTLKWRTIEEAAMTLAQQKAHQLDIRGSQQVFDATSGKYSTVPIRLVTRLVPKGITIGSFEPGATTDTESAFEVLYIKLFVNSKEMIEIDKFNYVAKFGDDDALASVRADLGLN